MNLSSVTGRATNLTILRSWNFLAVILLFGLTLYGFVSVIQIRPVILGDEWVYLVNSRILDSWDAEAGSLGNYLFNAVYKTTLLCGSDYYVCAKAINHVFLWVFYFSIFLTGKLFLNWKIALVVASAISLSPIRLYGSMFLPEALYFACIGLSIYFLARAILTEKHSHWAVTGIFLGLAMLAKPHTFLTLMAILMFSMILGLGWKAKSLSTSFRRILTIALSFFVTRLILGFALGGPSSLLILKSYGADETLGKLLESQTSIEPETPESIVGAGPVTAILSLFPQQLIIHLMVTIGLVGLCVALLISNFLRILFEKKREAQHNFALAVTILFITLQLSFVAFTGWVTGLGDDHTTRVLLRYYEFALPFMFLAATIVLFAKDFSEVRPWIRWVSAGSVFPLASMAFSGSYSTLTIQIADAPSLAGLVVDGFVFDAVAMLLVTGILVFAFFPKLLKFIFIPSLAFAFVATGFSAHNQYQLFRGEDEFFDAAGKQAALMLTDSELRNTVVVANSRFDGRAASFWMDSNNPLALFSPGSTISLSELPSSSSFALVLGEIELLGDFKIITSGDGFILYQITGSLNSP